MNDELEMMMKKAAFA